MIYTLPHADRSIENRHARLFLNDTEVGTVSVRGERGSWGFGEFTPSPGFLAFAPVFGRWSLLIHAGNAGERLGEAASDELRATECEIDAIRASLLLDNPEEWRQLRQLTIDASLIEWKE